MSEPLLPERFEELAPFLDWAVEPERARIEKKSAASMEEIFSFYNAMMPRLDEILDYLQDHLDGNKSTPAYLLYLLSLLLVEIATLVEL